MLPSEGKEMPPYSAPDSSSQLCSWAQRTASWLHFSLHPNSSSQFCNSAFQCRLQLLTSHLSYTILRILARFRTPLPKPACIPSTHRTPQ